MALATTPFFDWNINSTPTDLWTPTVGGWGFGAGPDIARRIPRHVPSRILSTDEGDIIWRPAADVFETDDAIVVHVDLPGVPKADIKIDLDGNQLIIHGEHRGVEGFESATSRVRERNIGRFRKIANLPAGVDMEHIEAKYQDGLLEVKVPKPQQMREKRVEIK